MTKVQMRMPTGELIWSPWPVTSHIVDTRGTVHEVDKTILRAVSGGYEIEVTFFEAPNTDAKSNHDGTGPGERPTKKVDTGGRRRGRKRNSMP